MLTVGEQSFLQNSGWKNKSILECHYVQANFKETQIEKMHIGQKVKLKLDAYPSLTYSGTIESFSPASGATFSLMPPDNATGNFNKVVQRIPVRIAIDSSPHIDLIKPGMSVSATVDLRT